MRDDTLIRALDVCLRKMQSGASLEEVLEIFPQLADELRPLLKAAQKASQAGTDIHAPRGAQARSRAAFLQEAHRRKQTRSGFYTTLFSSKFALASLMVILVIILGSVTTVAVSAQALPGDPLYGVKLATERTRLLLTDNQNQKLKLEQSFDHERVQEVEALIQKSRREEVNFAGGLSQMQGDTWIIGGIKVTLTSQTKLTGEFNLEYYVHVRGDLQPDGTVIASSLQVQTFDISGKIQVMSPDQWTVNGFTVDVTPQTIITGTPAIGSQVHVSAILLAGGHMLANQVDVTGSPPNPSAPSPTESSTATLQPSNSPIPAVIASPTPKPTRTLEPTESEDKGDSQATETPKATRTRVAEDTPEPTEVEKEEHTPEPTESEHEHSSATPTQVTEATNTPRPTESEEEKLPAPTFTPTPAPTQVVATAPPSPTLETTETHGATSTPEPTEAPDTSPTPTPTKEEHD